jgi:hypothetical protein
MDHAISMVALRGVLAAAGIVPLALLYRRWTDVAPAPRQESLPESLCDREREADALMKAHP